jgi:hypothetical protein
MFIYHRVYAALKLLSKPVGRRAFRHRPIASRFVRRGRLGGVSRETKLGTFGGWDGFWSEWHTNVVNKEINSSKRTIPTLKRVVTTRMLPLE